jgi:hypothetical protein
MLGHGPLGQWALGQLPSVDAVAAGAALDLDLALIPGAATGGASGDAVAPGAALELTLSLTAGAASGEGQIIVVIGGGAARRHDAVARGAHLELSVSLRPGRAVSDVSVRGAVLPLTVARIAAGTATGEATGYDNDFVLLLAA